MPVPVVVSFGAGGDNFGTRVSNSRLRWAALGTPEAANVSSGFSASALSESDFRGRECCGKGIADPDEDIEQRRRNDAAQRNVIRRFCVLLRDLGALGAGGAFEEGDAFVDRH